MFIANSKEVAFLHGPQLLQTQIHYILSAVGLQHGAFRDVLIDGFVPPPSTAAPMFPFYENSVEWDDFGEVINPDDYIIKDDDMDQASMRVSFFNNMHLFVHQFSSTCGVKTVVSFLRMVLS